MEVTFGFLEKKEKQMGKLDDLSCTLSDVQADLLQKKVDVLEAGMSGEEHEDADGSEDDSEDDSDDD